jgi:hypothetical protein
MRHSYIGVALLLLAAVPARAQEGRLSLFGHHYSVIAGASMFVPTGADTRALYGDRSFGPTLGLWSFDTRRGVGLSFDVGGRRLKDGSRRADVLEAGLGPRFLFTDADAGFAPYLTVRGDGYVVRLDHDDWRVKPGANAELGASIARHVVLSVRYDFVPKVERVDLSGVSTRLALKLF